MNELMSCWHIELSFYKLNLTKSFSHERLTGTLNTLRKASSEPCLPGELFEGPIYRTEEMEFVVQSDPVSCFESIFFNLIDRETIFFEKILFSEL